jgi:aerotaxis receptor
MERGEETISVTQIPSHTNCSLGQWYYGLGKREFGHLNEFVQLEEDHKKFHQVMKELVETHAISGNGKAKLDLDQCRTLANNIASSLDLLKQRI